MFKVIINVLSILGFGWSVLVFMIFSFGGSIKVIVNNPITKEKDILTNIQIDK